MSTAQEIFDDLTRSLEQISKSGAIKPYLGICANVRTERFFPYNLMTAWFRKKGYNNPTYPFRVLHEKHSWRPGGFRQRYATYLYNSQEFRMFAFHYIQENLADE